MSCSHYFLLLLFVVDKHQFSFRFGLFPYLSRIVRCRSSFNTISSNQNTHNTSAIKQQQNQTWTIINSPEIKSPWLAPVQNQSHQTFSFVICHLPPSNAFQHFVSMLFCSNIWHDAISVSIFGLFFHFFYSSSSCTLWIVPILDIHIREKNINCR